MTTPPAPHPARGDVTAVFSAQQFARTSKMRHSFERAQRWCLRAMQGHAWRQNSAWFVWCPNCVHPPTAALPGPKQPPCTMQKSPHVDRKGSNPHCAAPAGPLQLVRSCSPRAGPVAVPRMSHQSPLLRDALRLPSTHASKRHAQRVRPPRAARKARVVRASVPCSLRPSKYCSRANQIKSERDAFKTHLAHAQFKPKVKG